MAWFTHNNRPDPIPIGAALGVLIMVGMFIYAQLREPNPCRDAVPNRFGYCPDERQVLTPSDSGRWCPCAEVAK